MIRILIVGLLFTFFSCSSIKHIKGVHPAIQPLSVKSRSESTLKVEIQFNSSNEYDLGNSDQGDFNKLIGVQHTRNSHESTAMIGWRYFNNEFQLIPYYHTAPDLTEYGYTEVGKYRGFISMNQLFICEKGKRYTFYITVTDTHFKIYGEGNYHSFVPHSKGDKNVYRVLTWFGGNEPAPKSMALDLKYSWTNRNPFLK